ncbi:MAG: blue light sensor protein [Sphingomonas bacterium]|nr:blue light sensor protein [Sphingomonas bacterium]
MTVFSLLYASKSIIPTGEAEAEVDALVGVSRSRNRNADVTGCLIFGGGRFAQVLEGAELAVEDIMASISRDARHTDVTILERGIVAERRFAGWSLGYAGPSLFVQRTIATPVREALRGSPRGIADLLRIMVAFRAE